MSLRFATLAALSARPMTGYDLLQMFDRTVGFVWYAPHTQIYPELRRLEQEGLLESSEVPRGPKGRKREYRLTEAGFDRLRELASTPSEPSREKDPYRLKAAYLEWSEPDAARAQFALHIQHFEQWREEWERMATSLRDGTEPIVALRLQARPPEEHRAIVAAKVFAYEGLIARAEMEIAWARRGLALLDELYP